jgi:hypothetical protein
MTTLVPENYPKTELTISAAQEVSRETTRTPDHRLCATVARSADRRRNGDFWSKVTKTECCWIWNRSVFQGTGYGAFWVDGKAKKAHRVAFEELVGPIPTGLEILHDCDVRRCVRPGDGHTRLGTHQENQQDMARRRGRPQSGELNRHHKFTWPEIRDIRARASRGTRRQELADEYGTSVLYIQHIIAGRVWRERAESEVVA